ncbi:sulfurtransferase [Chiayiivirga flava]|uniref:Sulfurtransferase n=1 Tax=Chiayiivirga flava TaxID=659595 RepID=A0A7W8D7K8_9GAMM|nr:sulfurtransferase [Chiayiivirga flava]MBB5209411.1 thiosulfate/3-mercaptopyruvate sulfurtransferase [Chiayiivirga flava]
MRWRTLVSAADLADQIDAPDVAVVDCRFDLRDPAAGERAYAAGHLPRAVYASLDRDLADLSKQGRGRHPLPEADAFCAVLGRWGISPEHRVVAYDARDGAYAARLWWMLRLMGHDSVAVLDGGFDAWLRHGGAVERQIPRPRPAQYKARFNARAVATTAVVAARLASGNGVLIDARAAERFRGDAEPIDRVAGHIPGALNRPYTANLHDDGTFRPADELAGEFRALLDASPVGEAVLMCGSGVTACHNLLAMDHAGLRGARVYPGSWSEWISDPARPVARG